MGNGYANGNGDMATWVKHVGTLGSTGALIVIAAYLVYSLVERTMDAPTRSDLASTQQAMVERIIENRTTLDLHMQQVSRNDESVKLLLQQICVNTADDTNQRRACLAREP
jgi:hypothetical protein